jgi:hypothetical protein
MSTTTILPPSGPDSAPLPRVADHDDSDVDWSAIERDGVQWRLDRERETARPGAS